MTAVVKGSVCAIGGRDDGTLRVCCSSHGDILCVHHYARTHFVETMPEYGREHACSRAWRIGYFVTVDVDAIDETDAIFAGERAAGWPGDWSPPHQPVEVHGDLNGHAVSARIIRSQVLMIKEKTE